jgi:hypothetical protein
MATPFGVMQPGIAGVAWLSTLLWKNPLENSIPVGTCFLSIIQLRLLSGLSVLRELTPTAKLWLATLEYISTIPGCAAIHWGTERGQDDENICLLVQWETPIAWMKFQRSMALSLMLGVLAENPSNRCVPLSLPPSVAAPRTITLLRAAVSVESTSEEREQLTQCWKKLEAGWREEGIESYGDWLEDDVDLGPMPRNARKKEFCALILGEGEEVMGLKGRDDRVDQLARIFKTGHPLNIREFSLSAAGNWHAQAGEAEPPSEPYGFSSLLRLSPRRHYSEFTGIFYNQDAIQDKTIMATWRREREFPGPHGGYCQTGHINQYKSPALPLQAKNKEYMANFMWLIFKPGILDSDHLKREFLEFRWRIREAEECSDLVWCRSAEKPDECAMIICMSPFLAW